MTYGRARLWLGISAVGSLVVLATAALAFGLPQRFSRESTIGLHEVTTLMVVIGSYMAWMVPFDFLGGYWLPKRFQKSKQTLAQWINGYTRATMLQAVVFATCGSLIVLLGQAWGIGGSLCVITGVTALGWFARSRFVLARSIDSSEMKRRLDDVRAILVSWQIPLPRIAVVEHADRGFTGGIIGFGKQATVVIPQTWLSFGKEELATAIARRAFAISTGSYGRGLIMAFTWNLLGFFLCSLIPENGVATVAGLVVTLCWFTLWSFFGLLILPTVSRHASLMIDDELGRQGVPAEWISSTASSMDRLQDDEPQRPRWIEAIFHPVPSVHGRVRSERASGFAAWNVARTTLFFSWACLGFLSRSVHCNLGRPELWTMLPTD